MDEPQKHIDRRPPEHEGRPGWIGRGPANAGKMVVVLREFGFDVLNLFEDLLKEGQIVPQRRSAR